MGSSGQRRRKGNQHPQHLPKVGAHSEQHAERQAILDEMGLHDSPAWIRTTTGIVVTVLVVMALAALMWLVVFR